MDREHCIKCGLAVHTDFIDGALVHIDEDHRRNGCCPSGSLHAIPTWEELDADLHNHMQVHRLANTFLDRLPDEFRQPLPGGVGYGINPKLVQPLADLLQDFIAGVVAGVIDAGSEADAVNESEELNNAIVNELKGWTTEASS